jgi:hypothetical protein
VENVGRYIAGPDFIAKTDKLLAGAAENYIYEVLDSWDEGLK